MNHASAQTAHLPSWMTSPFMHETCMWLQAALSIAREAHKAQEASLASASEDMGLQHAQQVQRAAEAEGLVQQLQHQLVAAQVGVQGHVRTQQGCTVGKCNHSLSWDVPAQLPGSSLVSRAGGG